MAIIAQEHTSILVVDFFKKICLCSSENFVKVTAPSTMGKRKKEHVLN